MKIPRLTIVKADTQHTRVPNGIPRGKSTVHPWEDARGRPIGCCGTQGDRCWIQLNGIALYLFRRNGQAVRAITEPGADTRLVKDAYFRSVLPHALQVAGMEVLHASAVLGGNAVLALCGRAHAGKSTLAFGLAQKGYPLWADDAVAFECSGGQTLAFPIPFRSRLRADAGAYFDRDGQGEGRDAPFEQTVPEAPQPLTKIVILERVEEAERATSKEIVRLAADEGFMAILEHSYCLDPEDARRKRPMVETYLDLATEVPIFRARYVAGLNRVPDLLRRLAELI